MRAEDRHNTASTLRARTFTQKLLERLQARRLEIEDAILARVHGIPDSVGDEDAEYLAGMRAAASAGVAYSLAAIELGEVDPGPVPAAMLAQVRRAAGSGVGLDTLLRRYVAAYAVWGQFVVRAAESGGIRRQPAALDRTQRVQAALLDRLLSAVGKEYTSEIQRRALHPDQQHAKVVEGLLAGESLEPGELDYELEDWHLGVIAVGNGASDLLRGLATHLDRRLLLLPREQDTAWAWFGAQRRFGAEQLADLDLAPWPPDVSLAVGEPGRGIPGWRQTHGQAKAALPIARRQARPITRYSEVSLLAAMARDEVLLRFLTDAYLAPIASDRDGGKVLRETLRAYFSANGNVSSAAAALGISRQSINNRFARVEKLLGRSPVSSAAELEAAIRLEQLEDLIPLQVPQCQQVNVRPLVRDTLPSQITTPN